MEIVATFDEKELKEICGNEVIENIEEPWTDFKPATMKQYQSVNENNEDIFAKRYQNT